MKSSLNEAVAFDSMSILKEPFVHVRRVGHRWTMEGVASCRLGHRIDAFGAAVGEGIFAGWDWDGERLTVTNDRYGFYPLYFFATADSCAVSPSLPRMLAMGAPTELDYDALAVFFHLGHFLGDDSPFLAIRAIPPDVRFSWQGGKLELSGGLVVAKPQDMSREQAIEAYIDLFRRAVLRRIAPDKDFAVLLSGGRDSRHILFELARQNAKPKFCLTVDLPPAYNNSDAAIASLLAEALDIRHIVLPVGDPDFARESSKNVKTSFCADEHAWMMPAARYLCNQVDTIYDGIGGDVLSAGLYLTPRRLELFEARRLSELAGDLVGVRPTPPFVRSELRPKVGREAAVARLVTELTKHVHVPNPFSSFVFWNRTRREIALSTYGILSDVGTVFSPYLDHAVYDLLAGLPGHMFVDHGFHTETIARAFPGHAHIPYAEKAGASAMRAKDPGRRRLWRRFAVDVIRHCMLKSSALLNKSYLLPRLLRCLCDPFYLPSILWLGPPSVYLHQLELFRTHQWGAESSFLQSGE